MQILIAYATTDEQTRKIARHAMDHLARAGHGVELLSCGDADGLDLGRFGGAILAGSVHAGSFQKDLVHFAGEHAAALDRLPTMFLPVSLSAAGTDAEDWVGLRKCLTAFTEKTGWVPGRVEHVAGAFRFTEYDFFRAWAMRRIADQKGEAMGPDGDREYTNWPALDAALDSWVATLAAVRETA